MQKIIIPVFLVVALLIGAPLLHAQSSNKVWVVTWNGQPTPSSDVSARTISSDGSGSAIASGAAGSFVSQTNFSSLNSPYDIAVDPAMGKAYVLDNNVQGETPEYIYSFNLTGTPAQIAASAQIIYTMPVPQADVNASIHPFVSGIALDPVNHYLFFNQIDITTGSNSYVGRLDLATSATSNIHSSSNSSPTVHQYYTGQIPGWGQIAIDATNFYLGVYNTYTGNSGVYAALRNGSGSFSEVVTNSTGDTTFSNGLVCGVASDPQDHLIYYLASNAGIPNNLNTNQNALWVYDTVARTNRKISAGYPAYPNNIAVDSANGRYYFTLGQDGTEYPPQVNYQAIYTGTLGSTNAPTLFTTPQLSGLDAAGKINAGSVALQGVFVEDSPTLGSLSSTATYSANGAPVILAPSLAAGDPGSTLLAGATVAITGGTFTGDGDALAAVTNGTAITANYNGSTETLTLSGSDTVSNYQQVLRAVAFSSTNSDPTQGGIYTARTITWTVNDGSLFSRVATNTLTLLPANAPAANRMAITTATNGWLLLFTGVPNQSYVVQFAVSVSGPWSDLSSDLTSSASGLVQYDDLTVPQPKTRFYRVRPGP